MQQPHINNYHRNNKRQRKTEKQQVRQQHTNPPYGRCTLGWGYCPWLTFL